MQRNNRKHIIGSPSDQASLLFEKLKEKIGSTDEIADEAARRLATEQQLTSPKLRRQFSALVQRTEQLCYEIYLSRQNRFGEEVLREFLPTAGDKPVFEILDRLYLSVSQSRKTRAGQTFEATIRGLFRQCGYPFQEQCIVNGKPDFLMPNEAHYRKFATDCIIFTAKRTIRERWRQIATEGTRGKALYLATIDDGVSSKQAEEMLQNRIYLVLPHKLKSEIEAYKKAPNVISFEDFFTDHLNPAMDRWRRAGVVS
ncbi:MAG: hypothetical protein HZC54_16730 [Verrucomicrobia bacterium]|nr:hypothetical protein [Verrucomicrobiota bacterium]